MRWLANQAFEHPAQQIVLQETINAIEDCDARMQRLDEQLHGIVPTWSMRLWLPPTKRCVASPPASP